MSGPEGMRYKHTNTHLVQKYEIDWSIATAKTIYENEICKIIYTETDTD